MNDTLKASVLLAVTFLTIVAVVLYGVKGASASAPTGLPATVYSATSLTVSNTATQINATSTMCAARIVSTTGSAIMLGFTAAFGTTTSGSVGVWQAASTTVAYDSGLYGCGQLSAYSYTSAPLTVLMTH